jgi:Trehalose-phosphatase
MLQGVSKGGMVEAILTAAARTGAAPDFVLCIGDDRSDEDMFTAMEHVTFSPHLPAEVRACTLGFVVVRLWCCTPCVCHVAAPCKSALLGVPFKVLSCMDIVSLAAGVCMHSWAEAIQGALLRQRHSAFSPTSHCHAKASQSAFAWAYAFDHKLLDVSSCSHCPDFSLALGQQEDVLFTLARLAEASGAPPMAAAVSGSQYPQLVQRPSVTDMRTQQPVM